MNKKPWPKAQYLARRDGSLLTLGDLPSPEIKRWVMARKADVVEAVRSSLISREDACWRYSLTLDEFSEWQRAVDDFGTGALRATRTRINSRRAAKKNGDCRPSQPESNNSLPGVNLPATLVHGVTAKHD